MSCILSSRSQLWPALTPSPRVAQDAPTEILQTHVLSSKFGKFADINGKPVNGFVSFVVLYGPSADVPGIQRYSLQEPDL
jgi:hypothetical protein